MASPLCTLALLVAATLASPLKPQKAQNPPFFVLAGDSTTAVQSAGGGGWGSGFLNTTLHNGASGQNFGHNGATTVTFRDGGDWANVLAAAESSLPQYRPYVTIQFGHNDQKPEKNISIAQFVANLEQFVEEVRAIPAVPVLVTSLSRRKYRLAADGSATINEDLADVVAGTKEAAANSGAAIIDLNRASTDYLNAIGPDNAKTYNLNPTDNTHLNDEGSVVFGSMVASLLDDALPKLRKWVKPVREIAEAIEEGVYYFPELDGED